MSDRLKSILEQLQSLPALGGFGDIIDAIRSVYDVDHAYYYALSLGLDARDLGERRAEPLEDVDGILQHRGRQLAAMSYSPDWILRYFEARYFVVDPVLLGSVGSFDPIDWRSLDWSSAERKRFLEEAKDFGIGNQGFTIPVHGPGGQLAIFTVNKNCSDDEWDRLIAAYRSDFLLLAHFTHQRVLQLAGLGQNVPNRPLSNRERDAIRLIADGLSRGRASEVLGISENTFRVYVDSARHKLGALNIPHAIALAAHRGIIPPS